jgi:hypothetical protein
MGGSLILAWAILSGASIDFRAYGMAGQDEPSSLKAFLPDKIFLFFQRKWRRRQAELRRLLHVFLLNIYLESRSVYNCFISKHF